MGVYKLIDNIEDYLVKAENKKQAERQEYIAGKEDYVVKFYPSGIGYCSRKLVMQNLDYEKPEADPKFLRIMENGNSMHSRYEKLFGEMGILVAPELPIKDEELRISGRTDALIRVPKGSSAWELVLVELKSANDNQFGKMVKTNEPKVEHYQQLQLYMHLTGIHTGVLFVENKNNQDLWEFWCEYDGELCEKLVEKIKMVNSCSDAEILPERDYPKNSYECRYCDFREACWAQ